VAFSEANLTILILVYSSLFGEQIRTQLPLPNPLLADVGARIGNNVLISGLPVRTKPLSMADASRVIEARV